MHTANTGYMIAQGPGGVPVAIPIQAGGGMVAVQTVTSGAQGGQPQMVMVPVSGAGGYQPQMAQDVPPGGMTTGYYPQQPPSYAQVQCMTQKKQTGTVIELVLSLQYLLTQHEI